MQNAFAPPNTACRLSQVKPSAPADQRGLLRHGTGVRREHVREDQRVGDAVRQFVPGSERIGERMAGRRVDGAEADAAVERCDRQPGTRLDVAPILHRPA